MCCRASDSIRMSINIKYFIFHLTKKSKSKSIISILSYNIAIVLPFNIYWAIFIVTTCIPDFIELYRLCIAMHPLLNQWWWQYYYSYYYYSFGWSFQKHTHNCFIYVCYYCTNICQPVGGRYSLQNWTTQRMRRKFLQVCSNTLPICQPSCCFFNWGLKPVLYIVLLPLSTIFWIIGCFVMRKSCIHIMFAEVV